MSVSQKESKVLRKRNKTYSGFVNEETVASA